MPVNFIEIDSYLTETEQKNNLARFWDTVYISKKSNPLKFLLVLKYFFFETEQWVVKASWGCLTVNKYILAVDCNLQLISAPVTKNG